MKQYDHICGFEVQQTRKIEELGATLWEMRHGVTNARLVWLDRDSENKTFGIAFRTIPEDDTGVFHILEHSVLCGSAKYPVKEPFVELMKSSMQTFLNAMTFPDKTFYPVSSRNDKDFINLMRVYLDAVFFPAIYQKPEIFHQEGWHYELREGQEPSYKGVVFNEMKGALASADSIMVNALNRRMFPDTCYRFVSGGDPAHIPELSYEQFLANHKKFYHPSNAYIFLDGKVDLPAVMQVLEEYLAAFPAQTVQSEIACQKPVEAGAYTCCYEVSAGESLQKEARIAWGFGLGDYTNRLEITAMQALSQVLCGSNQSPLKQRILEAGLAEDVGLGVMDGMQQNYVVLNADNMEEDKADAIKSILMNTLREQINGALDRGHLRAILANMEFKARQRDYGYMPQGLGLGMDVLDSWLYGGDPGANLAVGALYEKLNGLADSGWYEKLLEKVFFQNGHTCQVLLLPSHTLGQEKVEQENARLAEAKAGWSEETRKTLTAQQEKLDAWQASQDRAEDVAKLPRLELCDVSQKPEDIPTAVTTLDGVPMVHHEIATGGISYESLYFDISDLEEKELSLAALLCQLYGQLDTRNRTALELQRDISFYLGDLNFSITPFSRQNTPESCRTCLCVSFSCLESKLPKAARLVLEVLRETVFTDTRQLQAILMQLKLQMEQTMVDAGHQMGVFRTLAGVSAEGVVQECTGGYSFYKYLKELSVQTLPDALHELCKRIFTTGRLTVSVTGNREDAILRQMASSLEKTESCKPDCAVKPWGMRKEGIVIPAEVSFAVQSGRLPRSGQMQVAAQIVSLAYLWNVVRVQGGAYGAGMNVLNNGCAFFYSYRDPNGPASLDCYRRTADFIRSFARENPDLTGFIIGTVSGTEPVLLPGKQGAVADGWYLRGITYGDRCSFRKQMLSTTAEDLLALADAVEALTRQGGTCMVGSKAQVEAGNPDTCYTL